ncbi:MAG: cyclophilin-like fold protein [Bulleidia sp.]
MKVILSDGRIELTAVLNDTVSAREFAAHLPCRLKGEDSGVDYCFQFPRVRFDPLELQDGWENGDLCLCDGWFAILYGGEETSSSHRNMMIIGHLEKESEEKLKELSGKVVLTIRSAEEMRGK